MGAPTTKYRPHPLAAGAESPDTIRMWAVLFYGVTILTAAYLSLSSGPWVLVLVAAGTLGSVLYTADPVVLKARGLGEVTVFLMWGSLIPLGAYLVQTGSLSALPVVLAVPTGLLVALVLLANNIRDIEYDGSVGVKTVPVRIGRSRGSILYKALLLATYLFIPASIAGGLLSQWSSVTLLTAPEALGLARMFAGQIPDNTDPRTAGLALKFSILYMVSFVLQIVAPLHLAI